MKLARPLSRATVHFPAGWDHLRLASWHWHAVRNSTGGGTAVFRHVTVTFAKVLAS